MYSDIRYGNQVLKQFLTLIKILRYAGIGELLRYISYKLRIIKAYNVSVLQYKIWRNKYEKKLIESVEEVGSENIKISIIMPVWNVDPVYLKRAIESVILQSYTNWELCIYDDASSNLKTLKMLKKYEGSQKIKICFGSENGHISYATNQALKLATGDYVLFMDNDDLLAPFALQHITNKIITMKPDIIYYDEDIIDKDDNRIIPIFKPQWSVDTFLSINFMAHATYKKSMIDKLKGMRVGYEGSQDYDLVLRALTYSPLIVHIHMVLYHWRELPSSTANKQGYGNKQYAHIASKNALHDYLATNNIRAQVSDGLTPISFRVQYELTDQPEVAIIIPIKDKVELLEVCYESIKKNTLYTNYKIFVIDNRSSEKQTLIYLKKLADAGHIEVMKYDAEYNYAAMHNWAVKQIKAKVLLFLNNDVKVITKGWLSSMLEFAQQDRIGAVGAMLLFNDGKLQHAGATLGIRGIIEHTFKYMYPSNTNVLGFGRVIQNVAAVTAACMMIRREIYLEVGGFDENLAISYNDMDLCMKLNQRGYLNVYQPFAQLYHYEAKSRGYDDTKPEKIARLKKEVDIFVTRWRTSITEGDPYYNPNLELERGYYEPKQ